MEQRKLLEILSKIEEEDYMHFFSDPVNEEEAPGYFDIISEPMDYSSIRSILPHTTTTTTTTTLNLYHSII